MRIATRSLILTLIGLTLLAGRHPTTAQNTQSEPLRVGIGFDAVLHTEDGLGIGFRTRWSRPVTWDVSIALDVGLTGFLLGGTEDASYAFDPQVSVIVTFPDVSRATYMLGGFGVYAPFGSGDHSDGGPTLHVGVGRAVPLRESTLYYEVDPTFIILRKSIGLSLPFRIGIII
jgi:hypothetical protein